MSRPDARVRVAVPSKGRLRDEVILLLGHAGFSTSMLRGAGSMATVEGLELIEMRPRDAAAALGAGQLDAAFVATDIAREHELTHLPAVPLGFSRSELVLASRDDDGRSGPGDLAGGVVATHLPALTRRYFAAAGIDVAVVAMGGSLEGVCAAGLADAIVDLRQTGTSLMTNRLRVLDSLGHCEAMFVRHEGTGALDDLTLRLEAVLEARRHRYVMVNVPRGRVEQLQRLFPGLTAPTVLPLAGEKDWVAVHFVVTAGDLWTRLSELRGLGATGIVMLEPGALVPWPPGRSARSLGGEHHDHRQNQQEHGDRGAVPGR